VAFSPTSRPTARTIAFGAWANRSRAQAGGRAARSGGGRMRAIFTGPGRHAAVVADPSVVMQERTSESDGRGRSAAEASWTRRARTPLFAGEDLQGGQVVFRRRPTHASGATEWGMIASLGIGEVSVYRRPSRRLFLDRRRAVKSVGSCSGCRRDLRTAIHTRSTACSRGSAAEHRRHGRDRTIAAEKKRSSTRFATAAAECRRSFINFRPGCRSAKAD